MNKEEALEFLTQHQPMPDDKDLSQELIDEYDKVRVFFLKNPDKECIPLLLNSFGKGDGLGVYQLVSDIMRNFSKADIVRHLQQSLLSKKGSVSYWSAQISAIFPDNQLVQSLAKLLKNQNPDIRYASITALEQIGGNDVLRLLRDRLEDEDDEEIKGLLTEIINN